MLLVELQEIEAGIIDLWQKSTIAQFRNDPDSSIVFVCPRYYWKALPDEHRASQARVMERYHQWHELLKRTHSTHSEEVQRELQEEHEYMIAAIELNTSWNTEPTLEQNRAYLAKKLDFFRRLLGSGSTQRDLVVIPDTNAMLKSANPMDYMGAVNSNSFAFVIVPTVLEELDGLKRNRHGQTVGQKAEKAIRIVKGLRAQGSMHEGVAMAKSIQVRMIPTEPKFQALPEWLDATNKDDRIIGSALEVQFKTPSAIVVLITDDLNLQNKAEMAFLPYAELPDGP